MGEWILKLDQVSKKYRKGKLGSGTLSRDIEAKARDLFFGKDKFTPNQKEWIWSLKDITLEVEMGDAIGVIGKNGAGKSTLLKILSKVTSPTSGSISGKGRIASLLEVGTGFHPELSGRENIFLNGAILGMRKAEIKKNFDEIVDFSGVEDFLDTPVKRYSSGMYVRLAFAVAAHLESEILIVDEVLAVGDAAFQKKCLGKMGSISKAQGRTVLFVSHNMQSIQNLCNKTLLLETGTCAAFGHTQEVIQQYTDKQVSFIPLQNRIDRKGDGQIKFNSIRFLELGTHKPLPSLISGKGLVIEIELCAEKMAPENNLELSVAVNDSFGNRLTLISNHISGQPIQRPNSELWVQYIQIDKLALTMGNYSLNLFVSSKGNIHDWIIDAAPFVIEGDNFYEHVTQTLGGKLGNFYLQFDYLK